MVRGTQNLSLPSGFIAFYCALCPWGWSVVFVCWMHCRGGVVRYQLLFWSWHLVTSRCWVDIGHGGTVYTLEIGTWFKTQYIPTMEDSSAWKGGDAAIPENLVEPGGHMLRKLASHRTNTAWLHVYEISKIIKLIERESRTGVARSRGWRGRHGQLLLSRYQVSVVQDE